MILSHCNNTDCCSWIWFNFKKIESELLLKSQVKRKLWTWNLLCVIYKYTNKRCLYSDKQMRGVNSKNNLLLLSRGCINHVHGSWEAFQSQGRALSGARRAGEVRGVGWCRPIQEGVTHFQKLGHKLVSFTFTSFLQGLASSTAEILHHNSIHHMGKLRKLKN